MVTYRRGHPKVEVNGATVGGAVLSDRVKGRDWHACRIEVIKKIGWDIFVEVKSILWLRID